MIKVETYTVANLSKATTGERFTFKGQDYTVEALDGYTNDAGRECCAVTVSTFCAKCGCLFEHTTRRRPKWLPKLCGRDHAPKPVHAKPTRQNATSSQGEGIGVGEAGPPPPGRFLDAVSPSAPTSAILEKVK